MPTEPADKKPGRKDQTFASRFRYPAVPLRHSAFIAPAQEVFKNSSCVFGAASWGM